MFADRLLVAWRSATVPGNAQADEVWTHELKWSPGPNNTLTVDASSPELPLVGSSVALHKGDQGIPALLSSRLWPEHRLVSAWQDWGRTLGATSGVPDVAVLFGPAPTTDAADDAFPLSGDGNYQVTFPAQTLRYVRITDYFVPGVGTSTGRLDEVQVF